MAKASNETEVMPVLLMENRIWKNSENEEVCDLRFLDLTTGKLIKYMIDGEKFADLNLPEVYPADKHIILLHTTSDGFRKSIVSAEYGDEIDLTEIN